MKSENFEVMGKLWEVSSFVREVIEREREREREREKICLPILIEVFTCSFSFHVKCLVDMEEKSGVYVSPTSPPAYTSEVTRNECRI